MMTQVVSYAAFFFQTELHTNSMLTASSCLGLYMSLSTLMRGETMILEGRCECGGLSYSSTAQNSHALCENTLFWMWNQSLNPCVSFHDAGKTALVRHKAPWQIWLAGDKERLIRDMRTYFCFESFQWRSVGLLRTTMQSSDLSSRLLLPFSPNLPVHGSHIFFYYYYAFIAPLCITCRESFTGTRQLHLWVLGKW